MCTRSRALSLWLAILLTGCPESGVKKPAPAGCTEFGQSCEVEPGKLGACVVRDGCTGEGCLVCQAQH